MRIVAALLLLVLLAGCNLYDKPGRDSLYLSKEFMTKNYAEVRSKVESMQHDGSDDLHIYYMYCNALRELGLPNDTVGIRTERQDLKRYVGAVCDMAFGKLRSARSKFMELISDDRTRLYAYYGLLEYAAVTGNREYLHEALMAVGKLPEKPKYLITGERFHSLGLAYLDGEFENMEMASHALSRDELADIGYPSFLVVPMIRRNAFAEMSSYADAGISVLGHVHHLYAVKADHIFLTKGRQATLDWLAQMIQLNPSMWELRYLEAMRLLDGGNQEEVMKAVNRITLLIDHRAHDYEFLIEAAHLLIDYHELDAAVRAIELISAYGKELDDSTNYAVFRARGYFLQGRDTDALDTLREVFRASPYHVRAATLLFEYAREKSDLTCSQDALLRLLHVDPWNQNTLTTIANTGASVSEDCCAARYALSQISLTEDRFMPAEIRVKSKDRLAALDHSCPVCDLSKPPMPRGCEITQSSPSQASPK